MVPAPPSHGSALHWDPILHPHPHPILQPIPAPQHPLVGNKHSPGPPLPLKGVQTLAVRFGSLQTRVEKGPRSPHPGAKPQIVLQGQK